MSAKTTNSARKRATTQRPKVLLGDCRMVLKDIPENSVHACITDPPYNYEFVGHKWDHQEIGRRLSRVESAGSTLVKNLPYGSGLAGGVRNTRWYERNRENVLEYTEWTREWASEVLRVCRPGAILAAFNSPRTAAHLQCAFEDVGFYARDLLVYRRSSGIPKGANISALLERRGVKGADQWQGWQSCLRSEWEAVVVVQKPLQNNYVETLTQFGTGLFNTADECGGFQSNILEGFKRDKKDDFNVHCTVKPLALMKKLVRMIAPADSGFVVLDPFAGSGTTLLAAKQHGCNYLGIEIVPEYIPIIETRLSSVASRPDVESAGVL